MLAIRWKGVLSVCCAASFLFSSCSIAPTPISDLMRAPRLSQEQIEVNRALRTALGTDNIELKYPRTGNYRSAFVFYDIDVDGVEEAIVFYKPGIDDSGVRIAILDQSNGSWEPVCDISSDGAGEVDYISFENISSTRYKNIIVGWQPENWQADIGKEKLYTIYTYEENDLHITSGGKYTESLVRDFDEDGLMDVLFFSVSTRRRNTVAFVTISGKKIRETDKLDLSKEIIDIVHMKSGKLPDGRQAVYLDVQLDGGGYATEIITVEGGRLTLQIDIASVYPDSPSFDSERSLSTEEQALLEEQYNQRQINFQLTRRSEEIYSNDINQDGIIEVPSSMPMLGYESSDELEELEEKIETMYLTSYSTLRNGVMKPIVSASVNVRAGYMVKFPDKWIDSVTVVSDGDVNQWQYIKYNQDLNDRSVELLRVSKVSKNDYQDRFITEPNLLAAKGLYQFYGYIPDTGEKDLRITNAELRDMFALL